MATTKKKAPKKKAPSKAASKPKAMGAATRKPKAAAKADKPKATKGARKRTEKIAEVTLRPIDPKLPKGKQEILSLQRIARAAEVSQTVEGQLTEARRTWNELMAKKREALSAAIEAGPNAKDAKRAIAQIARAHQSVGEIEAGRKTALADILQRKRRSQKLLTDSITNARQMELDFNEAEFNAAMQEVEADGTPDPSLADDDDGPSNVVPFPGQHAAE